MCTADFGDSPDGSGISAYVWGLGACHILGGTRMSKLVSRVAIVSASTLVVGLSAASPAVGGTSSGAVTIDAVGGYVAPDACQDGPPAYRLTVDETQVADYDDWSADITVTGPGGYYETDFLWDDEGWNKAWFCDANKPGTYNVTANVEINRYSDYSGFTSTYESVATTFEVEGPAPSAVAYGKRPYGAHGWKFPVRVTRASEAWPDKKVTMQARVCGTWHKILTKTTNATGRVTFFSTPRAGASSRSACGVRITRLPFRFYVAATAQTKASHSATFRITRR